MTQSSPLGESSEMSWVDSSIGAKPNSSINSLARAVAIVHSACVGGFLHVIVEEAIVPSTRDDDPGLHRHAQAFIDLGLRRVKHQFERCYSGIVAEAGRSLQGLLRVAFPIAEPATMRRSMWSAPTSLSR